MISVYFPVFLKLKSCFLTVTILVSKIFLITMHASFILPAPLFYHALKLITRAVIKMDDKCQLTFRVKYSKMKKGKAFSL